MNYKSPEIFSLGGGIIVERGYAASLTSGQDQIYFQTGPADDEFAN